MVTLSSVFHFLFTSSTLVLLPRICRNIYGLGYSPFARRYSGNHFCFLFLRLLRCFSSPGSPPTFVGCRTFSTAGYPIRIFTDLGLFAPPRDFSQLITSFFASESPGIPRAPFPSFLCLFRLSARVTSLLDFPNMSMSFLVLYDLCGYFLFYILLSLLSPFLLINRLFYRSPGQT